MMPNMEEPYRASRRAVIHGRFRKAFLVSGMVIISGCTVWVKPGATEAEFNGTKAACSSRAYSRFPPRLTEVQIMAGYYAPIQTQCTGNGYSSSCFTTGGQYIQPVTMMVDQNENPRGSDIRSCFYENGWTPKK